MRNKRKEKELDVIAFNQCPNDISLKDFEIWMNGFKVGYLYKRTRGICKSVDVFQKGICIGHAKSLTEAYILSGVSNSHICRLIKSKQKTKSGYSFKSGKL